MPRGRLYARGSGLSLRVVLTVACCVVATTAIREESSSRASKPTRAPCAPLRVVGQVRRWILPPLDSVALAEVVTRDAKRLRLLRHWRDAGPCAPVARRLGESPVSAVRRRPQSPYADQTLRADYPLMDFFPRLGLAGVESGGGERLPKTPHDPSRSSSRIHARILATAFLTLRA